MSMSGACMPAMSSGGLRGLSGDSDCRRTCRGAGVLGDERLYDGG